jgi:hypothetical protein
MKVTCGNYGMGDTLLMTAICKYFPFKFTILLPKDQEKFKIFFDNLAKVEITDNVPFEIMTKNSLPKLGNGHYTTRMLRGIFGSYGDLIDNRPLVISSNFSADTWTYEYLKDKPNPVIVSPMCSALAKDIRGISENDCSKIIELLKRKRYTPILILSSSYTYDKNIAEHVLIDLEITKYLSLMKKVGLYYGSNTGDKHLAVAVGAETHVFEPENHPMFNPSEWDYNHPTIKYYRGKDKWFQF